MANRTTQRGESPVLKIIPPVAVIVFVVALVVVFGMQLVGPGLPPVPAVEVPTTVSTVNPTPTRTLVPTMTYTPTVTPTNTPTTTNTSSPTSTVQPSPTKWEPIITIKPFSREDLDNVDTLFINSVVSHYTVMDITFLYDYAKEDPTDPFPAHNDVFLETLHEGRYPFIDRQHMLEIGEFDVECKSCYEEGKTYRDLWWEAPPADMCYLVERMYDRYGWVNSEIWYMSQNDYFWYGVLTPFAGRDFIEEIATEVQKYPTPENYLQLRLNIGVEKYQELQDALAPFVLMWYAKYVTPCYNLQYLVDQLSQ